MQTNNVVLISSEFQSYCVNKFAKILLVLAHKFGDNFLENCNS